MLAPFIVVNNCYWCDINLEKTLFTLKEYCNYSSLPNACYRCKVLLLMVINQPHLI